MLDDVNGRGERHRRGENCVAGPHAPRSQGDVKRGRARVHGQAGRGVDKRSNPLGELLRLRACGDPAGAQRGADGLDLFLADLRGVKWQELGASLTSHTLGEGHRGFGHGQRLPWRSERLLFNPSKLPVLQSFNNETNGLALHAAVIGRLPHGAPLVVR